MSKIRNQSTNNSMLYFLLGVIIIYFSQGSLYPSGSIISRMSLLLWLLIDIFCFFQYAFKYKLSSLEKNMFFFWLINACYWFISEKNLIGELGIVMPTFNSLKATSTTFLTYFPFRYYLKRDISIDKILSIFVVIILVVFIMSFYNVNNLLRDVYNVKSITNNMGYRFVALLPLIAICSKTRNTYLLMGISTYFIIMSSKRGAILCGILALIFFFVYSLKNIPRRKKIKYTIFILILFSFFIYSLYQIFLSNEYLMQRLIKMQYGNDESGDARINQVSVIIDYVCNGSLFHLLFGYGYDKSVMIAGNYAHNDWAELLANFGLFGVVIYLMFFIKLFRCFKDGQRYLSFKQKYMYMSVVGMWLMISMFSMGYLGDNSYLFMIAIAYIVSEIEKNKKLCLK